MRTQNRGSDASSVKIWFSAWKLGSESSQPCAQTGQSATCAATHALWPHDSGVLSTTGKQAGNACIPPTKAGCIPALAADEKARRT